MHIQTRDYGENQVIVAMADLAKLIALARQVAPVEVATEPDFSGADLMRLAESGGGLDFLHDEREDIYSLSDLKVCY